MDEFKVIEVEKQLKQTRTKDEYDILKDKINKKYSAEKFRKKIGNWI